MTKRYHPAFALALTAALCLSSVSSARSSELSGSGQRFVTPIAASPVPGPAPSGIVVVLDTQSFDDPSWQQAVQNPYVSGVALQIRWSDVEKMQDKPDWSKLDALFATAQSSDKWVHLIMYSGFFTPKWALAGVQTHRFAIQYGPGHGDVKPLPMPWDATYLNTWLTFVKEVSDRYRTSPALRLVAAGGPTSVSAEFTLPNSPSDLKEWISLGYTPSKYEAAWKTVLQAFAADFPGQYISLSVGEGLNINDKGRIEAGEHTRTRQAIVDQAMKILGNRFALQMSDVHAGPGPHSVSSDAEDQFIIGYNGSIITGFQMRTSAENDSTVMGAAGNPPSALNKSVNLALETNGAGKRINYLEIYEPDVLAAEMQPVLKYAASAFGPRRPGPFVPRTLY